MSAPLALAWARAQGRTSGLAQALQIEAHFVADRIEAPGTAPLRWVVSAWRTWRLLRTRRPSAVLLTLPPYPAVLVCLLFCRLHGTRLVLDLHSGVFQEPRWRWALRPTLAAARAADGCLVTNGELAEELRRAGVARVLVVDDPPLLPAPDLPRGGGGVVVPSGGSTDEPLEEVGRAALLLDVPVTVTGAGAPVPGVRRSGWLDDDAYLRTLAAADVVLCLTTREQTMQRGGYEALALGRPLVTSDTRVLREWFEGAAVHVAPTAAAIAAGVRDALARGPELERAMVALRERRRGDGAEQAAAVRRLLAPPVDGPPAA